MQPLPFLWTRGWGGAKASAWVPLPLGALRAPHDPVGTRSPGPERQVGQEAGGKAPGTGQGGPGCSRAHSALSIAAWLLGDLERDVGWWGWWGRETPSPVQPSPALSRSGAASPLHPSLIPPPNLTGPCCRAAWKREARSWRGCGGLPLLAHSCVTLVRLGVKKGPPPPPRGQGGGGPGGSWKEARGARAGGDQSVALEIDIVFQVASWGHLLSGLRVWLFIYVRTPAPYSVTKTHGS